MDRGPLPQHGWNDGPNAFREGASFPLSSGGRAEYETAAVAPAVVSHYHVELREKREPREPC